MKSRLVWISGAFAILWTFLVLRGAQLQFIPHEQIQSRQEKQFQTVVKLQARRGAILDRKGRELALSVKAYSLYADPAQIDKPRELSRKLANKLKMPVDQIFSRLKDQNRRFAWIARKLDPEIYEDISSWGAKGLGFVTEYKRIYPNEKLLAPVLGLVGTEGQGQEGLELSLDHHLQGNSKKLNVRRDARGRPLIMDGLIFAEAPEGKEVQLTIDSEIQHELEKELDKVTKEFKAEQAFGVILEAATSEVVALAASPNFDANRGNLVKPEKRRNKNTTDVIEPGSTVKTFALAAAIEEGLIQPNTKIDTEGGRMKVADRIIREADATHNWANLTVSEVLAYSSNVGTTKIAFMLGDKRLRAYLEKLGFGTKTGIELPGEARGNLPPTPWHPHLLSNISFGQGMSGTPLHVANAYAAIANGGIWRKPKIVKLTKDFETGDITENITLKDDERRVFSHETSQALRLMLTGVTSPGGTGIAARVDGFPVAGKTGTAQKASTTARGYVDGSYISSFAGFLPAQNPKYVIYIVVDQPRAQSYYGTVVAAPVFSRIATFITRLEGWAPVLMAEKNLVRAKHSKPGVIEKKPAISLDPTEEGLLAVPQFSNWTAREVLKALEGRKIEVRVVGSGFVHDTSPPAGASWGKGKYLTLYLRPKPKPVPRLDLVPWYETHAPVGDPLQPRASNIPGSLVQ